MRLNKYIAHTTGVSRRKADEIIESGVVSINGEVIAVGKEVDPDNDIVAIKGEVLKLPINHTTVILNKPVGYVCSRNSQAAGVETIYDILPSEFKHLKSAGRLDKDSSGLIVLTDDGDLAYRLTHPKFYKIKRYIVDLDKPLEPLHQQMIADFGINLEDGRSQLGLIRLNDERTKYQVEMHEGRNRQIRRTFASLGYTVVGLHRTDFGQYHIGELAPGEFRQV